MIRAVLSDLDGCLVDACEWHYEALNRALQTICETEITRDEHETTFNGIPTRTKLKLLVDQGRVPDNLVGKIWELKQQLTMQTIRDMAEIDEDKVALHTWLHHRGCLIACVTNSIRDTARLMLERTGQLEHMDYIVSNQDVKNPKPHPEGYIRAMIKFGSMPEDTLIIEDSDKGIRAAELSGARILRVADATQVTIETVAAAMGVVA